ncbi:signal transducer [Coprinopsis marcescibilis]|uniref:Signal transducer n=1 Tax=Coprinopsis marcescibilis TaxID=230819 RepID=A0A5C3KNX4_COPMA|nr:signal transducer [Coprinopsis marcescibilis]
MSTGSQPGTPVDDDDELEALYKSVLEGYTATQPPQPSPPPQLLQTTSSPAIRASTSSSSGRAVRPLPPTPGGSVGRAPKPPTATPSQQLATLPGSRPETPVVTITRELPEAFPADVGPSNWNDVSPNRTPQRPPLEPIDTGSAISGGETPASVGDSINAYRWSEVPQSPNEYIDPDALPVPEYIRNLENDPAAFNPQPIIDPSNFRDSGFEVDDQQYSEPLPHEHEERPPYEPDGPSYPDNIYQTLIHSYTMNEEDIAPSEVNTVMSDNYSMLRTPPARISSEELDVVHLPYLNEEDRAVTPPYNGSAAASSWDGNAPSDPPPRPGPSSYTQRKQYESYPEWTNEPGPSNLNRRVTNDLRAMRNFDPRQVLELTPEFQEYAQDTYDDPSAFLNLALLSHIAVQLQLKVPRGTHVKGSVPYPRAFTGKDVVTTIHSILEQKLIREHAGTSSDRRVALEVARSLQKQLFFVEVEWGSQVLLDGVEDVYMFLDDPEINLAERAELPSGVVTMLTKCYSVTCEEGYPCYSQSCPSRGMGKFLPQVPEQIVNPVKEDWTKGVPAQVLRDLPEFELNRQTIIHKIISKEEQYVRDLDIVENVFIVPLRKSPVLPLYMVDEFIDDVFGNILQLRDCNRRLLEVMYVRQREEAPIIKTIGDIFLDIATEFRKLYPLYVGRQFLASKRLKDELENNAEFRLYIEKCERQLTTTRGEARLDLWHYLNRPTEHLQKYPVLLQAVYKETTRENPDGDFLQAAIVAIKDLQHVAQLRTFQAAMGKGVAGKWEWHDLLTPSMRKKFTKEEGQRQSLIFELIKGEMTYVRDLENIENIYRKPLEDLEPSIIPPERADQFFTDVFHNFQELLAHHRRLVDKLHDIQLEEHPQINSVTAAIFDAALNFREAYMEYIPNYPIAAYRIDDEMEHNPRFREFVEEAVRHPDAHKLDMKTFINRPIPRLLRYELLLKEILGQTTIFHEDRSAIPEVIELISSLAREVQPGVESAKQKVEVWRYNSQLVYKPGEAVDMDLLDEHRSLVHTGKLLQQENGQWIDLFVMLFDNYLVLTKQKERDGMTKYNVVRKPIPLDLLHPVSFNEPFATRNPQASRLRTGITSTTDRNQNVFPFILHYTGRNGANFTLAAETPQTRTEWKHKIEEALGLRQAVADSNKVFEIETLSNDTFLVPPVNISAQAPAAYDPNVFTGKVTCSVPFKTAANRGLVAIGCAEGVWIGFRQDPRSMRRVLHVKNVTQVAVLEDFNIFLVLSDKNLFAYHIEALVPNPLNPQPYTSQSPSKINGSKEVLFFSVGMQHGRTLVIYMNKRGADSVFHVVEPVIDKITERPKAHSSSILPTGIFPKKNKSEWFRPYRDFFLQGETYDMIFLKARVAVLGAKGFEIVDLTDFRTVTIPQKDNPSLGPAAKRVEACKPMAMYRSSEDEFLLCYNEFGIYVDKHGLPSRESGAIEWEGTADRVALHTPYILIFDSRFIEVRHMDTCRLSQIIMGDGLRCIWDGRGLESHAAVPADSDNAFIQEPRVHAVMNEPAAQPTGRGIRGISQHVFQLVPTLPLYLPGSLSSPSHNNYYPQSFSPPRSPLMRSASYRP